MSIANKLIPVPFASSASDTYRYSIPQTNTTSNTNKASYDTGFPPVTMTDIAAGGIPPFGQDFNGVLNDITTAIRYMQSGNYQVYDATFSAAIGGYDKGAVIKGSDGNLYQSIIDANKNNPVGGDGWQSFGKGDYLPLSGGNLTGALTINNVAVLKVGDGGIYSTSLATLTDFKSLTNKTGFYKGFGLGASSATTNAPTGSGNSRLTIEARSDGTVAHYTVVENGSVYPRFYVGQHYTNTEVKWVEGITTANVATYAGKAVITETYLSSDGLSWYRKYSDGWIEQGGVKSGSFTSSTVHNLVTTFSNSNYTIILNALNSSDASVLVAAQQKTASSFSAEGTRSTTSNYGYATLTWYACGF